MINLLRNYYVTSTKPEKDQKTKRSNGPYCGDEMPPSFLSDSHKILIEANGGEIPNGMFYKGQRSTNQS